MSTIDDKLNFLIENTSGGVSEYETLLTMQNASEASITLQNDYKAVVSVISSMKLNSKSNIVPSNCGFTIVDMYDAKFNAYDVFIHDHVCVYVLFDAKKNTTLKITAETVTTEFAFIALK